MLGYMTKQEAKELGFTNSGNYYFVPVYLAFDAELGFCVVAKWAPLYFLMPVITLIERIVWALSMSDEPCMCAFRIGEPL